MSDLLIDLRLARRALFQSPAFTILVLLTLAIGIGATSAIFSAVNQVMFKPLTFRDPSRLVMLWESNQQRDWHQVHVAPANATDWRERVKSFEDVAMLTEAANSVSLGTKQPAQIKVAQVSGNAFTVLGAIPHLGRTFTEDETWAESAPVVVLGYDAWVRHFAADSAIVGQTATLDGVAYQVIGVLRPSFQYAINDAEVWTTLRWTAERRGSAWFRRAHVVRAVARLRPDVTPQQAANELSAVATQLEAEYPDTNRGMKAGFTSLHGFLVGDRRFPLLLLLGAVGVLQLIVCANVANLLLARALARRQEMAVRVALGAGRRRIARQVLTESLVLAVLGAVFGLAIGVYGLDSIAALRPPELPALSFQMDWRMVAFTISIAALSALLFGLQPAIASSQVDVNRQLADGSRTGSGGARGVTAANMLIAAELALAVMLVAGAGLMLRSVGELRSVDSGVNMENVLTFELNPPSGLYPTDEARAAFTQRLVDRLRSEPGIREVGAGRLVPFSGIGWSSDFTVDGWPADRFGVEVRHREATGGYFRALEIPLRSGSLFADHLAPGAPTPVVVNQAFAEKYFPGESPVGRRVTFDRQGDSTSTWYPVIGVVGNERMELTSEPVPEIIGHLASDVPSVMRFVVKTGVEPMSLLPVIRGTLESLDRGVPLLNPRTMQTVAIDALAFDRYLMILMGVFAMVALALAAVGVYGVSSQAAREPARAR